jgi:UDP-N-acetyl-D-mannosaminuronic acid transferase (WecB/TagA/CpsF family)
MSNTIIPPISSQHRQILGIRFFVGNAVAALEAGLAGGLVVAPAAPGLVNLAHDQDYRQALLGADLAITDSGFLVLLWNLMSRDNIPRVSGLEYLKLLLARPEFREPRQILWVMPSPASLQRTLAWLKAQGYPVQAEDLYVAPHYSKGPVSDEVLLSWVNQRRPRHIVICIGGGVQERLGLYLRRSCPGRPCIHCIGAAIGFLTGDQVHIPDWADRRILGWFFRCISDPARFVPRYARALRLPLLLWRYRSRLPDPIP